MRRLRAVFLASIISCFAFGQTYTVSTFAGGGLPVNIPATSASLGTITGVALDSAGNVFLASGSYNVVLRLDATTGMLTLLAGNGTQGFSGDNGPATGAQLNFPSGLAVDSAGNVYIADTYNNRVRKVSDGAITTAGQFFFSDEGFDPPVSIAVDSSGGVYIPDTYNYRVRKISGGVITTVAGNGTGGFSGDNGPATSARLGLTTTVAVDSAGNLYIADNNRIRKVSEGVITTVAGDGTFGFGGDDGPATSAQLNVASSVAVDSVGNLYIADLYNRRVRKVSGGVITSVAGTGSPGFSGDNGPATNAELGFPSSVAVDPAGNLYIADNVIFACPFVFGCPADNNYRIRKVTDGVITTVAGNGACCFGGDNGPPTAAQLATAYGVAIDRDGNAYIADTGNHRIRKVSNGAITTVAGTGTPGFSGDSGPATRAELNGPWSVAVDSSGNLFVADLFNSRVRKISSGVITTVAGGGSAFGDNGPASSARLNAPYGVAADSSGDVYIADANDQRIRKISNGVITTVAGNGTFGFSGDNGPATSAQLGQPTGVAVDSAGDLYIADTNNRRIRKVSNGVITTVAGGDSPQRENVPAGIGLGQPTGVALDSAGNLFISDWASGLILKVSNGIATVILRRNAFPFRTWGIAVDASGDVYGTDDNVYGAVGVAPGRVLVLTPGGPSPVNAASNTRKPE